MYPPGCERVRVGFAIMLPLLLFDSSVTGGEDGESAYVSSATHSSDIHSIDVMCNNKEFQVSIDVSTFKEEFPGVNPAKLTLGSGACVVDSSEADPLTWTYTLESCNNRRAMTPDQVHYSNLLVSSVVSEDNTHITRTTHWSLNVTCVMSRHLEVGSFNELEVDDVKNGMTIVARSNVSLVVGVFGEEEFIQARSLGAMAGDAGELVFIEIRVDHTLSDGEMLVLEDAMVTEDQELGSSVTSVHDLVIDRCPVDPEFQTYTSDQHVLHFAFPNLKYLDSTQKAYLHAYVMICKKYDVTCKRICTAGATVAGARITGRGARSVRAVSSAVAADNAGRGSVGEAAGEASRDAAAASQTPVALEADKRLNVHRVYYGPVTGQLDPAPITGNQTSFSRLFFILAFLVLLLLLASITYLGVSLYRTRRYTHCLRGSTRDRSGKDASPVSVEKPMISRDEPSCSAVTGSEDDLMLGKADDAAVMGNIDNLVDNSENTTPIDGLDNPVMSASDGDVPAADGDVPAADCDVPAADGYVPAADYDELAADYDVPAADSDVPAADSDVPAADSDVPAADCD